MIRLAQPCDVPDIMKLLHQVNDVHAEGRPDLFVKGRTKYTPEELIDLLADAMRPVFVDVDDSGTLSGYCFCVISDHKPSGHLHPHKNLYIDDLCVDADLRGSGVGHKLYDYVVDYARANGFHNITLNVWSCNPGAMRFYESLGLKPQKITLEQLL